MMVSVNADDLTLVVQLACLTESRDDDEQAALVRVAELVSPADRRRAINSWEPVE